jgi:diaminopimelate epimerase
VKISFSKYQGTGNDFIIIDNRKNIFDKKNSPLINKLCDRRFGIGADGLMLLNSSDKFDYEMKYYNADGKEGSMCGNGGRCLAAFAKRLGMIKAEAAFIAIDGAHHARIHAYDEQTLSATVFLKMNDVKKVESGNGYLFLDTGSPHYIIMVDNPDEVDVITEGRKIRYNDRFKETGTNVNFVHYDDEKIIARTYERGVEDETWSCGTGAVAAVLAVAEKGLLGEKMHCKLQTKGGELNVHFEKANGGYENIFLEGPATFVFDGEIET